MMIDIILVGILSMAVILIIRYLIKLKKSGGTCMGCPDNGSCSQKTSKNYTCGDN